MKPLLSCAAVVLAALLSGCRSTPPSGDSRLRITLTEEQRLAVISEMNTMLRSVHGSLAAIAHDSAAALTAAAHASGMAAAADPALESGLPAPWKQYAETVHGGFDRLAATGPGAGPALRDSALARLERVTNGCVACHATYRIATR